jgi:hypothetical protein
MPRIYENEPDDFETEYAKLPEDPELAFVKYVHNREAELKRTYATEETISSNHFHSDELLFATKVMAFHDAHDLMLLQKPKLEKWTNSFSSNFQKWKDELDRITIEIEIRHARRLKSIRTILAIPDPIKKQIHRHIEKVRSMLMELNLKPAKKEALLASLSRFSNEVDMDRTKLEAWGQWTIELASTTGAAARELKPVKDITDSIGNLLGKAKDIMDRLALPKPGEVKQIEHKPTDTEDSSEATNVEDASEDDDLPF